MDDALIEEVMPDLLPDTPSFVYVVFGQVPVFEIFQQRDTTRRYNALHTWLWLDEVASKRKAEICAEWLQVLAQRFMDGSTTVVRKLAGRLPRAHHLP